MSRAGRSCLFSQREKIEMRGPPTTTKAHRSPPPSRPPAPSALSPSGNPCKTVWGPGEGSGGGHSLKPLLLWGRLREGGGGGGRATLLKPTPRVTQKSPAGEDWRQSPLRSTEGHGAGSYSLSRWERVGVRAGGGGGRATLLKPTTRVTQKSPAGEDWRQSPLRSTEGHGAGSYSLSRWERVGVRAGGGGGRATLLKPTTLAPAGPLRPPPL